MATAAAAPPPSTVGEARSGVSRGQLCACAVVVPCFIVGTYQAEAYGVASGPAFFSSVPWRVSLLISFCTYINLYGCTCRTRRSTWTRPSETSNSLTSVSFSASFQGLAMVVSKNNRVIMSFTCVIAVFNVGMVVLWARSGVSRAQVWACAVVLPCFIVGAYLAVAYGVASQYGPASSFFGSVPWRLPLLVSFAVYLSTISCVRSYVNLYLPHTPVHVDRAIQNVGFVGVVQSIVLVAADDNRVVMAFTCVIAVFNVGVLALWAWLIGRYRHRGPGYHLPVASDSITTDETILGLNA
uniref:DUF7378 domain-containing protein n=1 Tax=Oryza punctata TaxID=4537 RepID=A0A0E0JNB4_ORYPU